MAELLLELLSEEIPARMQARAADDLKRLVGDGLKAAGLEFSKAEVFATPRRLALMVDGLPVSRPDLREEKKGPRVGSPEKAIEGFLKGAGLSSIEQAEKRATDKGEFYFAVVEKKGGNTADVLPGVILAAMNALPWPKSMKWGDGNFYWVRPLQSILTLFDGKIVPINIKNGKVAGTVADRIIDFGNYTVGHRFMAPEKVFVSSFANYRDMLRKAYVILDAEERKTIIRNKAASLAKSEGLTVRDDIGLLDEVAGLVEWPVAHVGKIDEAFMEVPQEVLVTSMRAHQKYFACLKPDGSLAPRFIVIANTETQDGGKIVVAGNERVLRARLSDAKFFWDQDRKSKLADRVPALKDIVFHAKLGTVAEKVDRIQALAAELLPFVPKADADLVRSAATLCKADLVTGMVGEFPELQGIMGRYYALHELEKRDVADAIAEHYRPLGPGDVVPSKPTSIAVALADKIDTLVGFWAIDEKPTGSKDPFALRRAALGIIRIVLENGLRLPLTRAFSAAATRLPKANAKLSDELLTFFADRLKVHLREQGVRHDLVSAVFALGNEDDLVRLMARVKALQEFLGSDNGKNLLVAYNRAANIVRAEEKKDKKTYAGSLDAALLKQDEEKAVASALDHAMPQVDKALAGENFVAAMAALAELRGPLDAFFDKVTVNADDAALRLNRLNLLTRIRSAMDRVADFSKIEG
ncbi:MAG: glyS [Alphaproteobacteria bacterium]|nr:glyS [Alphaproteobacteria bacterium]